MPKNNGLRNPDAFERFLTLESLLNPLILHTVVLHYFIISLLYDDIILSVADQYRGSEPISDQYLPGMFSAKFWPSGQVYSHVSKFI